MINNTNTYLWTTEFSSWALFFSVKALAMYNLDFQYTHAYKLLLERTRQRVGSPVGFPSLKGSVRVDKASLTQYVNDSAFFRGKPWEELKWRPESSRFESWRGWFTGSPQVLSLPLGGLGSKNDEQCWNSEWRSVSRRVSQSRASWGTKSEATAKPHCFCATARNRRNWTIIIIKYHHFVTIKGIWKSFFPQSLFLFFFVVLFSLYFFCWYSIETVEEIRVE